MDMNEVSKFEKVESPGKLKLSEAIRIGAKRRPQCSALMFQAGASCAIGAAYEALTGIYDGDISPNDVYPYVEAATGIDRSITCDVVMRNFYCTREQVADWLEAQGL